MKKNTKEENENKLKSLLKSLDITKWEKEIEDNDDFIIFLSKYNDDKFNNVYHLLFSKKRDASAIYKCNKITELLIKNNIPTIGLNIDGKLAYEFADGKSIYSLNLLKNQLDKEYNKQQLEQQLE